MTPSSRRRLPSILGALLLVGQPVTAAQTQPRTSADSGTTSVPVSQAITDAGLDPRIAEAQDLFSDHQVMESLRLLEDVIDDDPEMYEALWAAARSAIAQALLSSGRDVKNQWYKIAESYARRAIEVKPEDIEGLYWLLSAKGLRATQTGSREASTLGGEVYDLAHQVLEMDSLHAGAHHALGVLNFRVRRLPAIARFVARNFLGGAVMSLTSWEDAERYLKRAVELRPEYILFHLDLGRMYINRKRMDEARAQFQLVLDLPILEPPDRVFQRIAERRLRQTLD